jgi:alpha/beta superfamily hydrolase
MDLLLPGPVGALEAKLWLPEGAEPRAACAVCHPHPLHGGTMNTTAVYRTARGLERAGLAILRFNFRGVGRSEGTHDGRGGEEGDLSAALDHLEGEFPGKELWAAGFSFGSRTAASFARKDPRIARVVLVALPVRAFDCSFLRELQKPGLILMAGNDEFGTLADLKQGFPDLYPSLETDEIPGTDHFFQGATSELQTRVRRYAERALQERP